MNMKTYPENVILKVLEFHKNNLGFNKIQKILAIPRTSLSRLEKQLDIKLIRERKTSDLSDKKVFQHAVETMFYADAVMLYGKTKVQHWQRKHKSYFSKELRLGETYFDKLDCSEKWYILGLLWTDGCVHFKKEGGAVVRLSLNTRDKTLLEQIQKLIGFGSITDKISDTTSSLNLNSVYLAKKLESYGCISNKSLIVDFPDVPEKFLPDFILGCFDGDGGIYRDYIGFCSGSEKFHLGMAKILNSKTSREILYTRKEISNRKNPLYRIVLNGKDLEVINYIFNTSKSSLRMQRKLEAFNTYWKNKVSLR